MHEPPPFPLDEPHLGPDRIGGRADPSGRGRAAPLWLLLVGRAEVRRHWHLLLIAGTVSVVLGILTLIDSLDGALNVPERWFGLLLLLEGLGSFVVATTTLGAARRLRLLKGTLLLALAVLTMAATRHSTFLLAMIFGTVFVIDGAMRIVIAHLLKYPGWRMSVTLGAFSVAFGVFHLQPWPTWYAGTVGYCLATFLILTGVRVALIGVGIRRMPVGLETGPETQASSATADSLTVYVWTPTGQATTPARQRLIRRYVASVNARGIFSTGHAALAQGDDLYLSHYPAVEIDRSAGNLRTTLRAGPENDVPGRFLPSYAFEVDDWCEATVAVTLTGIDAARLRTFCEAYRRDSTYNFTGRNCSTTVASALDAAVEGAFARGGTPWRRLAKAMTTPEFWAAALLRNRAATMTWTPGLVLDYSRALSALLDPVAPVPAIAWADVRRRLLGPGRGRAMAGLSRLVRRRASPRPEPSEV